MLLIIYCCQSLRPGHCQSCTPFWITWVQFISPKHVDMQKGWKRKPERGRGRMCVRECVCVCEISGFTTSVCFSPGWRNIPWTRVQKRQMITKKKVRKMYHIEAKTWKKKKFFSHIRSMLLTSVKGPSASPGKLSTRTTVTHLYLEGWYRPLDPYNLPATAAEPGAG